PAPANHYTDRCSQVRNFGEHTWGLSMSAITFADYDSIANPATHAQRLSSAGSGKCPLDTNSAPPGTNSAERGT
ncbi:hypothetical protein, partial [Mycobacteroides abscessus]|uniref:hypothetical protein n=1 Tax=Mycobacteroides abscessus TaxID=36809 RepID=UPI001A95BD5C